jgi:hypothetical protein
MLTPASTDALNRASRLSYGEATGITQTVRNFAASLGFAILGTILVTELHNRVTGDLVAKGESAAQANAVASRLGQSQSSSNATSAIPHFVRLDFAYASRTVLYVMCGIMALAAVVGFFGLVPGVQQEGQAMEEQGDVAESRDVEAALPEPGHP